MEERLIKQTKVVVETPVKNRTLPCDNNKTKSIVTAGKYVIWTFGTSHVTDTCERTERRTSVQHTLLERQVVLHLHAVQDRRFQ